MKPQVVLHITAGCQTYIYAYIWRADVNECEVNNGGCDEKRKCTNAAGSRICADCPSGWVNEGETQCKGMWEISNVLLAMWYIAAGCQTYVYAYI